MYGKDTLVLETGFPGEQCGPAYSARVSSNARTLEPGVDMLTVQFFLAHNTHRHPCAICPLLVTSG